ncbi:MAG: GGDEF domain-containing protein, partial [Calditrichaceae bacterium]
GSLSYFASAGIPSSELSEFKIKLSDDLINLLHEEGGILWIKSHADILDKSLKEFTKILNVHSFIIGNISDLHTRSKDRIEIDNMLNNIKSEPITDFNKNMIFFLDKSKTNKLFATYEVRILKSFLQTVSVIYENMVLYSQLRQLYEKKAQEAILDGLTKIYNYRYFMQELEKEINRATRYSQIFSLLMIDIDHFKRYNDNYGHVAGDRILQNLANLLLGNIRNTDTVARYGGEEFVIILPGLDRKEALKLGEKLRKLVSNFSFKNDDIKEDCHITISIGIACLPDDSAERSELIKSADKALYYAKQTGRDKVCSSADFPEEL